MAKDMKSFMDDKKKAKGKKGGAKGKKKRMDYSAIRNVRSA